MGEAGGGKPGYNNPVKSFLHILVVPLLFGCLYLLTSCSIFNSPSQSATQTSAARPTSTLPPELATQQLRLVSPPSCLQAEFASIDTQTPQGDLMAWSPTGSLLALDVPDNQRWGWYVGVILIYDAAAKQELYTSQGNFVYGDLTWSPGADYLAFVKFTADINLYTVMTLRLRDRALVDYFPGDAAHTDDFSSQKGIDSWNANGALVVTSSCGADCSRFYNIDVTTGQVTAISDKRKSEDASLALKNLFISPDGRLKVVKDDQGMSWMASQKDGKTYFLTADPIDEIKWSADSQYFALRLVDRVSVYKTSCP